MFSSFPLMRMDTFYGPKFMFGCGTSAGVLNSRLSLYHTHLTRHSLSTGTVQRFIRFLIWAIVILSNALPSTKIASSALCIACSFPSYKWNRIFNKENRIFKFSWDQNRIVKKKGNITYRFAKNCFIIQTNTHTSLWMSWKFISPSTQGVFMEPPGSPGKKYHEQPPHVDLHLVHWQRLWGVGRTQQQSTSSYEQFTACSLCTPCTTSPQGRCVFVLRIHERWGN